MAGFADADDPDTIRIPFIFVPHGHPLPTEWLRDHPEAFRVPAVFVPRGDGDGLDVQLAPDAGGLPDAPAAATLASATRNRPGFGPPTLLPDAAEEFASAAAEFGAIALPEFTDREQADWDLLQSQS